MVSYNQVLLFFAGGDDEQVRCFAKTDVQNMSFISPEIVIGVCAPPGDGLKGERCNEFFRGTCQKHIHLCACLCQLGSQIRCFVRGNGTCDPK